MKDLKTKNQPVDALSLFVAGPASALIEKDKGKPTADIEAAFKDLGFEKSEFGSVGSNPGARGPKPLARDAVGRSTPAP